MGVVYEAIDREQNARVALKTLRALSGDALLRFKNEFRALCDLTHPNLVALRELIEEAGHWFFTMEFVDGMDFIRYVRPAEAQPAADFPTERSPAEGVPQSTPTARPRAVGGYDEARLRSALAQLAEGLHALHRERLVHRDIKPSNILVSAAGRLVLLDFGLVSHFVGSADQTASNRVIGTVHYMAPEQASGQPVGPASDWYAMGTLLYQALMGRLPFDGTGLEVLIQKRRQEPPPPEGVAPDLAALCMELLRRDPARRPAGDEVVRRLALPATAEIIAKPASRSSAGPFVGRERELSALAKTHAQLDEGVPIVVYVEGESGVGKSALVRHFVESLSSATRPCVVLAGRCYERESVPYKAVDGVIDSLSKHMMRLPTAAAAALLPLRASLLAQVFPVLRRVEAIAGVPRPTQQILDPQELRTRVFGAVRELLVRLAERSPVVVVIDDLHWADPDGLMLLREILRPPEAPRLMLIATLRLGANRESLSPLGDLEPAPTRLSLSPLPPAEARQLATLLMGSGGDAGETAEAIATEAGGHPLFIDELVRHVRSGGRRGDLHLEEALWDRVSKLADQTRRIVEIVAIAGVPIRADVAARAGAVTFSDFVSELATLRHANLVRSGGNRRSDLIEPYHDRVRESVIEHMDLEARRSAHRRLALALETAEKVDPEMLSVHWRGAGERDPAARYSEQAAEQAAAALAFDRAAKLYREALDLRGPGAADVRRLQRKLGDALANAGRGGEAAEVYLRAAEGAPQTEALDLRRLGAEQFLLSGHIDQGLQGLTKVLAAVNMKLPATPRRALLSLLLGRAYLRVRGLGHRARDRSELADSELVRIDVCWSVAIGLGLVDHIFGNDFQTRHTLLALRAGEPYRVARAISMQACFATTSGTPAKKRMRRLVAQATELAKEVGHPHAIAIASGAAGFEHYMQGRWKPAHEQFAHTERLLRERCTGVTWQIDSMVLFSMNCLALMGDFQELARQLDVHLRDAESRGDLYADTNLRSGHCNLAWLVQDDVETARRFAERAMAQWSHQGFHIEHMYDLIAQTRIDLYAGEAQSAWERVNAAWRPLHRSHLHRVEVTRIVTLYLRASSALALAEKTGERRFLRVAQQDARTLARQQAPWAQPCAATFAAAVASIEGHRDRAVALLAEAHQKHRACDMGLHAAVVQRRQGELVGGEAGRELVAAADAWMAAQKIRRPDRIARMIAPGFASAS